MTRPLLLLHGALGTSAQFDALREHWPHALTLDFEGHGTRPAERPFRMEHFAANVAEFIALRALAPVDVFGYSMGGYVALCLARTQPALIHRVFTLGTKFDWTPENATRETRLLDADKIAAKVPHFARQLEALHTGLGWREVLARTAEMMTHLGAHPTLSPADLAQIQHPVRISIGDHDTTAGVDASAAAYRALPNAELQVFPNTPHPLEKVEVRRVVEAVKEFFA